ncbi:unnamed protein product, partial [Vitis vinifera]|uniref:Uncharacterized protein n=1 Tax=Vitis vinifera TaxID=29760 RepID=D7U0T2_VITVI
MVLHFQVCNTLKFRLELAKREVLAFFRKFRGISKHVDLNSLFQAQNLIDSVNLDNIKFNICHALIVFFISTCFDQKAHMGLSIMSPGLDSLLLKLLT